MEGATGRKNMRGRPRGEPTAVVRLPLPLASLARRLREGTLRAGDISRFLAVEPGDRRTIRFIEGTAACGFPSPADDYLEHPLDFNELLIRNPAATFAVRLASDSMTGAGLFPGDIAVIDRSVTPRPGLHRAGADRRRIHHQALPAAGRQDRAAGRKRGLSGHRS